MQQPSLPLLLISVNDAQSICGKVLTVLMLKAQTAVKDKLWSCSMQLQPRAVLAYDKHGIASDPALSRH